MSIIKEMTMRLLWMTAMSIVAAGVANGREPRGETIVYELIGSGICLACPSYTITLRPDGQGIFNGNRNTTVIGGRRFQANAKQVRDFIARLRPYRPTGEALMDRPPLCGPLATDQDSVDIRWQGTGTSSHLAFYAGCDVEKNARMASKIFAAPGVLPIAKLIGKH